MVSGPDFPTGTPSASSSAQNGTDFLSPESPLNPGDHIALPTHYHPHTGPLLHTPPVSYSYSMPSATCSHHVEPLEIILRTDRLVCRCVGANADPAVLSGHVVLRLSEPTNIREISLDFVGKALAITSCQDAYLFPYSNPHEGYHVFPFQLELPSSLPPSMNCEHASASVYYKLRATALRPAFSANFHAVKPFWLIKGLSPEAMDYTQTLEIERTWTGKIMYSFMIPHKAFAVGDTIPALVRMSPVSKGVSVLSISVDIKEHAVTNWKGRSESSSTTLQSEAFNIVDGKAVRLSASNPAAGAMAQDANSSVSGPPRSGDTSASRSSLTSLARSMSLTNLMGLGGPVPSEGASSTIPGHGAVTGLSLDPSTSARHQAFNAATMFGPSSAATDTLSFSRRSFLEQGVTIPESESPPPASAVDTNLSMALDDNCDVDTTLSIFIPTSATPSHLPHPTSSDASSIPSPLSVAHKIEFRALLSNLDGHTSELRCALPINILDGYLLREVRSATHATRSLLFGNDTGIPQHGIGNDETDIVPAELPSYSSHVRDRVANAEMVASVEGGHGRVVVATNPLLLSSTPGSPSGNGWTAGDSAPVSGWSTPYDGIGTPPQGYSHGIRQDRNPVAFDQELMLSLGQVVRSYGAPEHGNSRGGSRAPTRAQSRASSPEPGQHSDTHAAGLHPTAGSRAGFHLPHFKGFSTLGTSRGANRTHGATSSPSGSRPHSRTGHHPNSPISIAPQHLMENGVASAEESNPLSRVPSYSISSRGFLGGGVTPLQLYRDLPSYEQAEASSRINRTQSDPSLTYTTRESRP
ncbi:hypothetical protein BS47DRAFT_1336079, partial [Hydnum rufescens UP504]